MAISPSHELVVFGVLWSAAESIAYFLKYDLSGSGQFFTILLFSILSGVLRTVYSYMTDAPLGLERESVAAKRIAQIQRARWEPRLAQQLLHDVLDDFEDELAAIQKGRVFVPIDSTPPPSEYMAWASRRIGSLEQMIKVAMNLLVRDFGSVLLSEYSGSKPARIRSVVYRIRDFYASTIQFERDCLKVRPPEGAERLHMFQLDWADPVRDGVRQLFTLTDQLISVDLKSEVQFKYTITMEPPSSMDECTKELQLLERRGWGKE